MRVEALSPYHHWRICYQLISDTYGKTFAAYIGVLEATETHRNFSPLVNGGGGRSLPENRREKVSYKEALDVFHNSIVDLQNQGFTWRG